MSEYSGNENLELVGLSKNFNNWMYNEISPGLKGDILEVGSGLGTFSEMIIRDFSNSAITLTDISPSYVKKLEDKFLGKNITICKLDLNCIEDYEKIGYEKFDSIIALNVLEHVENDILALQQLYKMLRKDGILILLVPCHKFLFNTIDSNIGHFRRYTKNELRSKIQKTKFITVKMFYFNMIGIVGWYLNGNLGKTSEINSTAYRIFDRIVPLSRFVEKVLNKKIGLSLICLLRK